MNREKFQSEIVDVFKDNYGDEYEVRAIINNDQIIIKLYEGTEFVEEVQIETVGSFMNIDLVKIRIFEESIDNSDNLVAKDYLINAESWAIFILVSSLWDY